MKILKYDQNPQSTHNLFPSSIIIFITEVNVIEKFLKNSSGIRKILGPKNQCFYPLHHSTKFRLYNFL